MTEPAPTPEAMQLAHDAYASIVDDIECNEIDEKIIKRLALVIGEAAQRARAEALEEAAQVATNIAEDYRGLYVLEGFTEDLESKEVAEGIASRIRTLIQPAPESKR